MDAQGNRYGPYDTDVAGSEAEAFLEGAWHDAMDWISGVVSGANLTFAGLTATLSATPSTPLHVWSHGGYLIRTDPWSSASPATPAVGPPRRDMIVARRQLTAGATPGKTFLTLLQGTPAASNPADPTFDPDNDEPLWSYQVPGNGGTVVTGQRDLRRSRIGIRSMPGQPQLMYSDTVTLSFSSISFASTFITFPPGLFSSPPRMAGGLLDDGSLGPLSLHFRDLTKDGCTAVIKSATNISGSIPASWIALGS